MIATITPALDPALVAALLGAVSACIAVALRYRRTGAGGVDSSAHPWAPQGWPRPLTLVERQEALARATEVAQLTVGEEVWGAFEQDGYTELPSAREPGTRYRPA